MKTVKGVDPKVIARLKLDNHKIEHVHGCMSCPGVYLASLKKKYNARTKHWESAGYQVIYDDQFFRRQEQIAELKSAAMAELTEASHDPQKYLAIATRLVKDDGGVHRPSVPDPAHTRANGSEFMLDLVESTRWTVARVARFRIFPAPAGM